MQMKIFDKIWTENKKITGTGHTTRQNCHLSFSRLWITF